ncbi:MAG: hypothetical protein RBR85_02860 [Bacilli bacterium]|jgi:hypothetical protein|nr:hypothetical protein [Bacilli bacterium]
MSQKKVLQRIGEDTAYTFKGLHKTADWLNIEYKIYLTLPIVFSIIVLGFDDYFGSFTLKVIAVVSLVFTFMVIKNQNEYEKINTYRQLADKYKCLHDKAETYYYEDNEINLIELQNTKANYSKELNEHPISMIGRFWSKKVIEEEMNLKWIKEEV